MIALTAGRNIPDSDGERVKAELDAFSKQVGSEVLKQLTRFVLERKTGTIRLQVFVNDGRIEKANMEPHYGIALDGNRLE